MLESREAVKIAVEAMEDKKAEDIRVIQINEVSSIADYFIIASGDNIKQVHAIANLVEENLGKNGWNPKQIEGLQNSNWILMDYGDFIVHIFDKDSRLFYNLERIWRDGKEIPCNQL